MRLSFLALAAVAAFNSAPSYAAQLSYPSPTVLVTDTGAKLITAAVSLHFDPSQTGQKETDQFGRNSFLFEDAVDLTITAKAASASVFDLNAWVSTFHRELVIFNDTDTFLRALDSDLSSDLSGKQDLSLGEIIAPLTGGGSGSWVDSFYSIDAGSFRFIAALEYVGDFTSGTVPIPLPAGFVLLASGLGALGVRKSLFNRR